MKILLIALIACVVDAAAAPQAENSEKIIKEKVVARSSAEDESISTALVQREVKIQSDSAARGGFTIFEDNSEGWVWWQDISLDRQMLLSVQSLTSDASDKVSWVLVKNGKMSVFQHPGASGELLHFVASDAGGDENDSNWRGGRLKIVSIDANKAVIEEAPGFFSQISTLDAEGRPSKVGKTVARHRRLISLTLLK